MVKAAVLMGRGVEGCGVTRNVIEFMKFNKETRVYATIDKIWPRRNSFNFEKKEFLASNIDEVNDIAQEINSWADVVIVFSLPSTKHEDISVNNFLDLLKAIKAPKSLIQVDHKNASITRNARLKDMCEEMDLLMTHSSQGAFAAWCNKHGVSTPIVTMGVGFDYDTHREKWWKPIEQQRHNMLKWIGRCAMWKGPVEVIDLHNKYLRQQGFITTLEGLEGSVQSLLILYEDGFDKQIPRDVKELFRGARKKTAVNFYDKEELNQPPYLYPEYKNEECMERLSRSAFGSDLYHLEPNLYGNNIEYCHAEVVATGTIPVFHKHFGEHIIHRVSGDTAFSHTDSGTLWYDPLNVSELAIKMNALSKDLGLRDEMREQSYVFWKTHSDYSFVYQDIINKAKVAKSFVKETKQTGLSEFFV